MPSHYEELRASSGNELYERIKSDADELRRIGYGGKMPPLQIDRMNERIRRLSEVFKPIENETKIKLAELLLDIHRTASRLQGKDILRSMHFSYAMGIDQTMRVVEFAVLRLVSETK